MPKASASSSALITHFRLVTSARLSRTAPATAKQAASTGFSQRTKNSVSSASNDLYDALTKRCSTSTRSWSTQRSSVFVPPMSPAMMRMALLPLERVLVRRRAVDDRHRDIEQAQVDGELAAVVHQVVEDDGAQECRLRKCDHRLAVFEKRERLIQQPV